MAQVLLVAAERVHARRIYRESNLAVKDPEHGAGNSYCCTAISDARYHLGVTPDVLLAKDLLFEVFTGTSVQDHDSGYIWDPIDLETEPRILGLLLLREMLKPERRPRTAKR